MAIDLQLAAALRAYEAGRAQPTARRRHVVVRPDALVLAMLKMAGEDTSVHVVALGRVGRPAVVRHVPDPRRRDDQYALFE